MLSNASAKESKRGQRNSEERTFGNKTDRKKSLLELPRLCQQLKIGHSTQDNFGFQLLQFYRKTFKKGLYIAKH